MQLLATIYSWSFWIASFVIDKHFAPLVCDAYSYPHIFRRPLLRNSKHSSWRISSSTLMTSLNPDIESDQALKRNATEPPKQQLHTHHHIAIRTRDIETAISFYSLLGFSTETKFRAGPARAAWLTNSGTRIEIIEVPSHILQEEPGTRQRALDLIVNEQLLGLNHFALDVTEFTNNLPNSTVDEPSNTTYSQPIIIYSLKKYLDYINTQSLETFGKSLRVAVPPQQKIIGTNVYELAFLYDADGSIVELLYFVQSLDMETEESMKDGWTPWDGTGFCGMVK